MVLKADNHFIQPSRREFLRLARTYGFTAATVAAGGAIFSEEAVAQTAREEQQREKEAKTTLNMAVEYTLQQERALPQMQLNMKDNIQNFSRGEVYVKLHPPASLGVGSPLAAKAQQNVVQVVIVSVSNFSPYAPAIDLINIPYWSNTDQKFVNLVSSKAWRDEVHPKVNAHGFEILTYIVYDPRTVSTRKGFGKVLRVPADMQGMKFRIPSSAALAQIYRLCGANATPIAWGETPTAIREGVADGLDPTIGGLLAFGFKDLLGSITFTSQVQDAQVYVCNLNWLRAQTKTARDAIMDGAEATFLQNLAAVPAARAYNMDQMSRAGVTLHVPTPDEIKQWQDACGAQRPEWREFKEKFAGSVAQFEKFREAAETRSPYYVKDV